MGKVIPLIARANDAHPEARLRLPLTRREFLKGTGVLVGTIAAGNALSLLAPSSVWALELTALSTDEGAAIVKMARVLYPHRKLSDAVYALVAKDLDAAAAADPAKATMLKDGVAALDRAAGGKFARASLAKQRPAPTPMEAHPFSNAAAGQCLTSLYNNDMAFASFGYEGGSWEKGGYAKRGFQDLQWLPSPPSEASPKPFYS